MKQKMSQQHGSMCCITLQMHYVCTVTKDLYNLHACICNHRITTPTASSPCFVWAGHGSAVTTAHGPCSHTIQACRIIIAHLRRCLNYNIDNRAEARLITYTSFYIQIGLCACPSSLRFRACVPEQYNTVCVCICMPCICVSPLVQTQGPARLHRPRRTLGLRCTCGMSGPMLCTRPPECPPAGPVPAEVHAFDRRVDYGNCIPSCTLSLVLEGTSRGRARRAGPTRRDRVTPASPSRCTATSTHAHGGSTSKPSTSVWEMQVQQLQTHLQIWRSRDAVPALCLAMKTHPTPACPPTISHHHSLSPRDASHRRGCRVNTRALRSCAGTPQATSRRPREDKRTFTGPARCTPFAQPASPPDRVESPMRSRQHLGASRALTSGRHREKELRPGGSRDLQEVEDEEEATVVTSESQLKDAVARMAKHIRIEDHLDLRSRSGRSRDRLPPPVTALDVVSSSVRSIRVRSVLRCVLCSY